MSYQSKKSADIAAIIEKYRPSLGPYEDIYKYFHSHPELSTLEKKTAASIHEYLEKIGPDGYEIKKNIGGHGTAAILKNGRGLTLLLRADIDALPVLEKTGLPYASNARMLDTEGKEQPVMHACGHDMHITSLLAAAKLLHSARDTWSGTLILIFQPAEEKGVGAKAMVDDGLYTKHGVPVPDMLIGAHVGPEKAGTLGTRPKAMMATADSMSITLFGRGGHASKPQSTVDPVMMAAYTATRLQTIVSREIAPGDPAVVTVASIRAGEAENVIPEFSELKVNVRTFDADVRDKALAAIKRIVQAECDASGATSPPAYATISHLPLTYNDPEITTLLSAQMASYYGDAFNPSFGPLSGSEDFGILGSSVGRPTCFWMYGGTDPEVWDDLEREGRQGEVPGNHSAYFAPVVQPTLTVAVDGYALSALTWLVKG